MEEAAKDREGLPQDGMQRAAQNEARDEVRGKMENAAQGALPEGTPLAGELYRHFKGNLYQVIGTAYDAGTMEPMVVYWALGGQGRWFVRPLAEFLSPVDKAKDPDSTAKRRFERVEPEAVFGGGMPSGEKEAVFGGGASSGEKEPLFGRGASSGEKAPLFGGGASSGGEEPVFGGKAKFGVQNQLSGSVEMREIRKDTPGQGQAFTAKEDAPDWSNPEAEKVRPELLRFLDAETPGEKLAVLREIRGKLDEELMTNIELSIDLTPDERESLERRLSLVEKNLEKRVKYEGTRLR